MLFRHAGELGAKIFDGHKVVEMEFEGDPTTTKPISAKWSNKAGETGTIAFDYVVDASGRVGILSTKYAKTRTYNQGLKNVASWGYWTGCDVYLPGTPRENSPFFEALQGTLEFDPYLTVLIFILFSRRERLGMDDPSP